MIVEPIKETLPAVVGPEAIVIEPAFTSRWPVPKLSVTPLVFAKLLADPAPAVSRTTIEPLFVVTFAPIEIVDPCKIKPAPAKLMEIGDEI